MAIIKKALVFYLYGNRNAGDMAICIGAIEFLKAQGFNVTFVSRFSEAEQEYYNSVAYINNYYPDITVYPGPFSFERDFGILKKLMSYCKSLLKVFGIIPDPLTRKLINDADVVFFNGGNLLRGTNLTDYLRLIALFYPIKISQRLSKRLFCLPQSTASKSFLGKLILKQYLRCFDKIFIREDISYKSLQVDFPDMTFYNSTDLAFFCKDTCLAHDELINICRIDNNVKNVAIVLRNTGIGDIGKLNKDTQNKLLNRLKEFVKSHVEYKYWVIIQTKKDIDISYAFFTDVKNVGVFEIVECHDPLMLREIYKKMDFVISMRLHAAILSLSARTPVIGLFSKEWGLKNPGIMSDYEMPFIIVEDNNDSLLEVYKDIPVNSKQIIDSVIEKNYNAMRIL